MRVPPEFTWRYLHVSAKCPREVALIREPRCECDLKKGFHGAGQLVASEFHTQLPKVFAQSAAEVATEAAGEVDRVYPDCGSHVTKGHGLGEAVMH
jgi:hypothetical protein